MASASGKCFLERIFFHSIGVLLYYIPLTLPSPPTTGERIKVRGS
jgi:hypothetical protein